MVIQAKIAVSEPSPARLDSTVETHGRYVLHEIKDAEHRLLSTDDFNGALMRLLHLDAPVGAFLDTLDNCSPHPLPNFSKLVKAGLSFAIIAELRAGDETPPAQVTPEAFQDLQVNSEAVLHAMTNRWQYLRMLDPQQVPDPEVGDWTTHMAQFVFLTLDRTYPNDDGPPVLQD